MTEPEVTVLDYGMGNLFSVSRAFELCGAKVKISSLAEDVGRASRLVLPGVGAFQEGMAELRARELVVPVLDYVKSGRPFLGICLGMQMLLSVSEEFGRHEGLGVIPGTVVAIPNLGSEGEPHKIPHIGWNVLKPSLNDETSWSETILEDCAPGSAAYFVHSYSVEPENSGHRLADCFYDGLRISAVVRKDNVWGCQFHPEKSGPVGLGIIKRFLSLKT